MFSPPNCFCNEQCASLTEKNQYITWRTVGLLYLKTSELFVSKVELTCYTYQIRRISIHYTFWHALCHLCIQKKITKKTPEILHMETTFHEVHRCTVHMVIWALKLKIYPFNNQLIKICSFMSQSEIHCDDGWNFFQL